MPFRDVAGKICLRNKIYLPSATLGKQCPQLLLTPRIDVSLSLGQRLLRFRGILKAPVRVRRPTGDRKKGAKNWKKIYSNDDNKSKKKKKTTTTTKRKGKKKRKKQDKKKY